MKPVAVVLTSMPAKLARDCDQALSHEGFLVVRARDQEELITMIRSYWPHLVLIGASPDDASGGLAWLFLLMELTMSERKRLELVIVSGELQSEEVQKAAELGVHDILLQSQDPRALLYRLRKICRRVKSLPGIVWKSGRDKATRLRMSLDGRILGICETGICVESSLYATEPTHGFECTLRALDDWGMKSPLLKLVNCDFESHEKDGNGCFKTRSYYQVLGWSEKDRHKLRAWIAQTRMRKAVLA